jgi:hypothetical protein
VGHEERPTPLEMAKELDGMERDVTSWEADFLNSILTRLDRGLPISHAQQKKLEELYEHYLGQDADDMEAEVDL